MRSTDVTPYKPIEAYGVIGNLRTVALVGLDGSIDWCCLPELDDPSVFAAILDHQKGGRFRIAPAGPWESSQRYLEGTNVLETIFDTPSGRFILTDFMPLHGTIIGAGNPPTTPEICRLLHCDAGDVEVDIEWSPRFDYARADTRIERVGECFTATGGRRRLAVGGFSPEAARVEDTPFGPVLRARIRLHEGDRRPIAVRYNRWQVRSDLDHRMEDLHGTVRAWREWAHLCEGGNCTFDGSWHGLITRSELVLKLLTHPDSGAVAAAATTSLPEEIGGVRNWDYRYSWIRDASFTVQALVALGHHAEAVDFVHWVQGVSMKKGSRQLELQIMYGLHGEEELPEITLDHLEGYRGSRPVRIGNGAAKQRQLDIYGELLGSAYELLRLGDALDPEVGVFLAAVADRAAALWREPDSGIWEVRSGPAHFVHSKVMAWVALDRACLLAERFQMPGDPALWRSEADKIRQAVLAEGYDAALGSFVQSFGSKTMDASLLLIPVVEFLPFDDPRVQGTIDAILERLTHNGIVYRYDGEDGLPGGEGAFGLTTFWMVDALTLSGRIDEAQGLFTGMANRANHVGLYAEEFDTTTGAFLGNFPQAFTHIGFVNSALHLARYEGRKAPAPAPLGSEQHAGEAGRRAGAAA